MSYSRRETDEACRSEIVLEKYYVAFIKFVYLNASPWVETCAVSLVIFYAGQFNHI